MHLAVEQDETATDMELVCRLQDGDMRAFEVIYARYHPKVLRFVLRKTLPDRELAEDIAADTFVRAYKNIDSFKGIYRGGLGAWLMTIARNNLNDYWKLPVVRKSVHLDDDLWGRLNILSQRLDHVPAPEEIVVAEMTREMHGADLAWAFAKLKQRHQVCLWYRFFEELSMLETADIMQVSEAAVKMTQARALDSLRRLMRGAQMA